MSDGRRGDVLTGEQAQVILDGIPAPALCDLCGLHPPTEKRFKGPLPFHLCELCVPAFGRRPR